MAEQPPDNMAQFLGVPDRVAELVVRYYDASLSEQETAELREALVDSPAARDWFVRLGLQTQTLAEALAPQYSDAEESPFAQLVEMEARAEAELVDLDQRMSQADSQETRHHNKPDTLSGHDLISAGRYLLRHGLRTQAAAYGALAALLLIALFLFGPWGDRPTDSSSPEIADSQTERPTPTHVATLTATHNAQWGTTPAERALARGSALHAGTRLTLTAGFAEITTNDGAIAILEAPATIELIENDNALHLHTGKMVGICETESSKGFVVRTPHMDVIDLGTRFGVDASRADATHVHVFEGEVQVARVDAGANNAPQHLVAGESVSASASNAAITRTEYEPAHFAVLTRASLPMQGTGVGLTIGEADPRWLVISEDGQPMDTPQPLVVSDHPGLVGGLPNDPASSQWLSFNPMRDADRGQSLDYVLQTQIELPGTIDPASSRLILNFAADNLLAALIVNGNRIDIHSDAPSRGWQKLTPVEVSAEHLRTGENTIGFVVRNFHGGNARSNFVALRLQWQVQTQIRLPVARINATVPDSASTPGHVLNLLTLEKPYATQ